MEDTFLLIFWFFLSIGIQLNSHHTSSIFFEPKLTKIIYYNYILSMKTWRLQNAYKHPNFVTLKISSIYIALFIVVLENNNINISVNWDFIFSESVA